MYVSTYMLLLYINMYYILYKYIFLSLMCDYSLNFGVYVLLSLSLWTYANLTNFYTNYRGGLTHLVHLIG